MPFCPTRPKWRADRREDGPNPTIGEAFFVLIGSVAQIVWGIDRPIVCSRMLLITPAKTNAARRLRCDVVLYRTC